jgi:hypothetical protein
VVDGYGWWRIAKSVITWGRRCQQWLSGAGVGSTGSKSARGCGWKHGVGRDGRKGASPKLENEPALRVLVTISRLQILERGISLSSARTARLA